MYNAPFLPSIDVAVIKKYKKQLLIGIPLVIAIGVWFFIFRSVTIDESGVTGYSPFASKVSVQKNPMRLNFVVESVIQSSYTFTLPQEIMEYIKNEDNVKKAQLQVSYRKPVEGVMYFTSSNSSHFFALWKDGKRIKDYRFSYNGTLLLTRTWNNKQLASADVYDDQGKVFKSVKFVDRKGEYKLYSAQKILVYKETYDLNQYEDAITVTEYENNGSEKYTTKYTNENFDSILETDKRSLFVQ
jgi:hypothetical protein